MTISLPGSSKRGLASLLGRRKEEQTLKIQPKKKLEGHEVARLFDKQSRAAEAKPIKPAKLNDTEKQDRERLTNLRGALYSRD
ncbi:MAG: hypothetical protein AAFQ09_09115 [Pseudomonadota bacterium]